MKTDRRSGLRKVLTILAVILAVMLIAMAVDVTDIDLREPLKPKRQENLVALIRELVRPDILKYDNQTRSTNMSVRMPCSENVQGSQVSIEDRVAILAPNCVTTTQDVLNLTGDGFAPATNGVVGWYPFGAQLPRKVAEFRTDTEGSFAVSFTMPDVRESEDPQRLEIVEVLNRDLTGLSDTTIETLDKILETILMALMASTLGTILAIPISFLGARNLMSGIGWPLAAIMGAIIGLPIGAFVGFQVTDILVDLSDFARVQPLFGFAVLILDLFVLWLILRYGSPLFSVEQPSTGQRMTWSLLIVFALLLSIFAVALVARLGIEFGLWLEALLGFFGFVGNFIFVISDVLRVFLPAFVAFVSALGVASYTSRLGQEAILRLEVGPARLLTGALAVFGLSLFVFAIASAINWICLFGLCQQLPQEPYELRFTLAALSIATGLILGLLSLTSDPKHPYSVGMVTYTITRTILNVMRAIEPIILGFVIVVWVGLGPLAGVLALMLNSIADLGKLFSEQVENIEEGPVEAVTATGASRMQTVVYAVIPQIIPHYTAFIFYRWDINVRLSTIIGFVGGGGIGLILFRATNLTQYRQAAVMVMAIAIVVTALDFISSQIRKRII
jgi:phosphonate ABC transporter permease subunit PhnE